MPTGSVAADPVFLWRLVGAFLVRARHWAVAVRFFLLPLVASPHDSDM
ncbi:hypothetical protein J2853_006554 [Streptosporangium lutulentum]|uniref:Uncharacterized protein n=1 Tax=Streptosporangium lutulentum TaxID=1461250 RepID=A0ABT9QKR0_9ACTN|nr:hypothetical protein [Streptosporangium lutulentum]